MDRFHFFPTDYVGPIRTALLDANVVSILDGIAEKGSKYAAQDTVVKARLRDLVHRLDDDVVVGPGVGAAESVMRRGTQLREIDNFHRRSTNALRLLGDDLAALSSWLNGEDITLESRVGSDVPPEAAGLEINLAIVRDNLLVPSYAVLLKAHQLHMQNRDPLVSFQMLTEFAAELHGRGSREVMLGAMLLAGNHTGRSTALNIMKLHERQPAQVTMDRLWNTSFDLTYSRIATMPSLPGFDGFLPRPVVFVTADRHLSVLLELVRLAGAVPHNHGGGVTADFVALRKVVDDRFLDDVVAILNQNAVQMMRDEADLHLVQRVRRYKSKKYVAELERWIARS